MDAFLSALTPALAETVRKAVAETGEDRLRMVVSQYTLGEELWPTERFTAEMIALQYLRESRFTATPDLTGQIDRALDRRATRTSGSLAPLVAGAAAGAVAAGAPRGLLILTDRAIQNRWESLDKDHATLRGRFHLAAAEVLRNTTNRTDWDLIGRVFSETGFDSSIWENQVAARFRSNLMSHLTGIIGRAAWSGQRRVLDQLPEGMTLADFAEAVGPWAREYTARLVFNQSTLTERAARASLMRFLEHGLPERTIASQLKMTFGLDLRHALAVDNYRRRLSDDKVRVGPLRRMVNAYADRLIVQRLDLLANTEIMTSINFGQQVMWEKAMNDGLLPVDTRKVWVTAADERVCPVCRPMDNVRVPLTSGFDTPSGNVYVPPVHPRCRCIVMLAEHQVIDWAEIAEVDDATSPVGKHLPGVHDQKSHGKKGPVRFGPAQSESAAGSKLGTTVSGMGLAALAVGGFFVLRRVPPGTALRPNTWNPTTPTRPIRELPDGERLFPSLLKDDLHEHVIRMNAGKKPNAPWIEPIVDELKGSTRFFRDSYERGTLRDYKPEFAQMVAGAPSVERKLYRGISTKQEIADSYQVGRTFSIGPSSFASDISHTRMFSAPLYGSQPVVFVAKPSTRGLSLDSWRKWGMDETEWLVSGKFRITRVWNDTNYRASPTKFVEVEQIGILDPGIAARWIAKILSSRPALGIGGF